MVLIISLHEKPIEESKDKDKDEDEGEDKDTNKDQPEEMKTAEPREENKVKTDNVSEPSEPKDVNEG